MKTQIQIETKNSKHWDSPLLKDIGFIKKNLRYPFNKRTISQLIWIAFSVLFFVFIFLMVLFLNDVIPKSLDFSRRNLLSIFPLIFISFISILGILRQWHELKFLAIKTNSFEAGNIRLLQTFFKSQNLAYFHNPNAAEVFQISSRVLDKKYDLREIMVFIADDKRILFNSHFVSSWGDKGKRTASMKENRKMAKALKRFIDAHQHGPNGYFSEKAIGK